ncbi:DUF3425 domain-containing protein [Aspergillus saccharolyticus JOP 1030-1]|uniref:BZIP domain-containing protein n=1 Tax=Aspergillus saccharolyticus JOP 1030-1 TaxID=1450539 RepID=A0A318ZHN0_9EURO|nr:hypothetical protein BP01DRAFT_337785 [Aspergillus saccharolyticus JOP 1030-1]PYH46445.1 hypothetical protein BP01DRAFT_337785 [Aspergillus saccharolyticus JOP 1030-1]
MALVKEEEPRRSILAEVAAGSAVDPEDDWAGMGDRKERRRRQNRLNQRAYRELHIPSSTSSFSTQLARSPSRKTTTATTTATITTTTSTTTRRPRKPCADPITHSNLQLLLAQFTRVAYDSYMTGSPTLDHLLTVSRINVYRAFATNMLTLGMGPGSDWMHDDALSVFTTKSPHNALDPSALPPHLRPTQLQRTVPHHPWLDFFPLPRFRDNLVQMADRFDDEELCLDIMGFWDTPTETYSLLVWGEPSDPANWEVSEDFLRKWPWVLRGCAELMASTNRWRARRGERMLLRYL